MKFKSLESSFTPFWPALAIFAVLGFGAVYYHLAHLPTVTAELVNATSNRFVGEAPGEADEVEVKLSFRVTARGGDVFLDGEIPSAEDVRHGRGFGWALSPDSGAGARVVAAVFAPADGIKSRDVAAPRKRFHVADGQTRNFYFVARVAAERDNVAVGVQVDAVRWGESSAGTARHRATFDPDKFKTDLVTGLHVR